ncbi:hypothetical protein K1719_018654 [Acacia pycnantha]|nr:hypothetical protein K1719_018654 [Acacia pycnantha]
MGRKMEDLKPALMMIVVQVGYAGVSILYKVVSNDKGISLTILIAYRFLFASFFMVPLAFFVERASLPQNLFVQAVSLAGATYATAMCNLIPGATFVLALCFG